MSKLQRLIYEKDQRKFQIIEYLFHQDSPVTIGVLAKKNNCSVRTIKYDIEEIKSDLKNISGSIISSTEGIILKVPLHIGIDYFQEKIFERTTAFKFIETLFFYESLTLQEAGKILYTSSSALYRLCDQLKPILKDYGLHLKTTPLKIEGDETIIRNFYTTYFSQRYSVDKWPFADFSLPILYQITDYLLKLYNLESKMFDYYNFCIRVVIHIIRLQKKCFTEIDHAWFHDAHLQHETDDLYELLVTNLAPFNLDSETINLYVTPIRIKLSKANIIYRARKTENTVEKLIATLSEQYELEKQEHRYMKFELNYLLNLYSAYPIEEKNTNLLLNEPRDYIFLDLYQDEYPFFYETAKTGVIELCEAYAIPPHEHIHLRLLYVLLAKWENLTFQLFSKHSSCSILVYSHYNINNAHNIAKELNNLLDTSVIISVYDDFLLTEERLKTYSFDILLTTTTLDLALEQPIIYLHRKGLNLVIEDIKKLTKNFAREHTHNQLRK